VPLNLESFITNHCYNVFPTTNNECHCASRVFNNSIYQINEIVGNYLPVLNYDGIISPEWQEILDFKEQLKLDDYLTILAKISNDTELSEDEQKENKKRICLIYEKLVDLYPSLHFTEKNELKKWSSENKLLAKDGKFYYPKDLSIITVDGFSAGNQIFTENNVEEGIMSLIEFLGVKVIREFIPDISNPKLNPNVKNRIQEILPYILLLDEKRKEINYSKKFKKLEKLLAEINFYEAQEIVLSYMSNGKKVKGSSVRSYLEKTKLYFKGDFKNPTALYAIVPEIASLLDIEYLKDEFKLFFQLNIQGIEEFILEEGIDSKHLKRSEILDLRKLYEDEEEIKQSNIEIDNSSEKSRISVSGDAKEKIFEILKANSFNVPATIKIDFTVVTGIINPKGLPVKLVVKSGKAGKLYFNPSEWLALSEPNTQLFVVTRGNNVRNITLSDLIENNELFFMRFNSNAFAVNTNLKIFAEFFKYLKYTHFIFDTPESTSDYLQEFGLNERNKSAIDLIADDKNLLL